MGICWSGDLHNICGLTWPIGEVNWIGGAEGVCVLGNDTDGRQEMEEK